MSMLAARMDGRRRRTPRRAAGCFAAGCVSPTVRTARFALIFQHGGRTRTTGNTERLSQSAALKRTLVNGKSFLQSQRRRQSDGLLRGSRSSSVLRSQSRSCGTGAASEAARRRRAGHFAIGPRWVLCIASLRNRLGSRGFSCRSWGAPKMPTALEYLRASASIGLYQRETFLCGPRSWTVRVLPK
jgi:hypothetical protein